jgi:LPXTG-motif cell wall-anchored protein
VTVNGTVSGKQVSETSANCAGTITVKPPVVPPTPVYTCDGLTAVQTGAADAAGNQEYTLTATASASNATITNYVFTFGDQNQTQTVTSSNTAAVATHTYAPGTYNPSVQVTVTLPDGTTKQVTAAACATKITIAAPTCTAPNGQTYPVGSAQCQPQQTCTAPNGQTYPTGSSQCTPTCTSPTNGQTYPMGSVECQPPAPTLPNTGAGDTLALFAGVSLGAAILHWLFIGRRFGRSQL